MCIVHILPTNDYERNLFFITIISSPKRQIWFVIMLLSTPSCASITVFYFADNVVFVDNPLKEENITFQVKKQAISFTKK